MTSTTTSRISGFSASAAIKIPCRAATTANITLSGAQTIDGVAVVSGDRVLVKNQTTQAENGIYVADTSTWSRAQDFDGTGDAVTGTLVLVTAGTTNADTFWRVTTANDVDIGSDSITWSQSNTSLAGVSSFMEGVLGVASTAALRAAAGIPSTFADNALIRADTTNNVQGSTLWTLSDAGVLNGADGVLQRAELKDYSESYSTGVVVDTAATFNLENGNVFAATFSTTGGSTASTLTFSNPPATGRAGSFTLIATQGGKHSITYPSGVAWASGASPTLSATGTDVLTFFTVSAGSTWYGFHAGADLK